MTSERRFKFASMALEIKQPQKSGSSKQWSLRRKSCGIEATEKNYVISQDTVDITQLKSKRQWVEERLSTFVWQCF